MIRTIITIMLFVTTARSQDLGTLQRLAMQQSAGFLAPPLASNSNSEMFNYAHAGAFLPYEADGVERPSATGPANATESSVSELTNGYGSYVAEVVSSGTLNQSRSRMRYSGGEFAMNTTYEYAFLYRMTVAAGTDTSRQFRVTSRVDNVNTTVEQVMGLNASEWTLITGTFTTTTGSVLNYVEIGIYCAYNSTTGGALGDTMQFKLSIKPQ